jgi:hypothetical protein
MSANMLEPPRTCGDLVYIDHPEALLRRGT